MLIMLGRVLGVALLFFGAVATVSGHLWGLIPAAVGTILWLAASADEKRGQL